MLIKIDRRDALTLAGIATIGLSRQATAAPSQSMASLKAVGLDSYDTYRRMFATAAHNGQSAWWYVGITTMAVSDIGEAPTGQVTALMGCLTQDQGPDASHVIWKEVDTFRDIVTGAVATPWTNPVTGMQDTRYGMMEDSGRFTIRRGPDGVAITLDQPMVDSVSVDAAVEGDRVCLTQVEEKKFQGAFDSGPTAVRLTRKIYASLTDLKGGAPNVPARGFYSVLRYSSGRHTNSGLMEKAAMDQKLNPESWARLKAAFPGYFIGDRYAPRWE